MNILIFKTSIMNKSDVESIAPILDKVTRDGNWNVDLEDCDKVLRIESDIANVKTICTLLNNLGYMCDILDD